MFNVFLDGVYQSSHSTFTGACRHARLQAAINRNAYFTVFEAGEKTRQWVNDGSEEIMPGVPDYIIAPYTESGPQTQLNARRRSPVLRTRLPVHNTARPGC